MKFQVKMNMNYKRNRTQLYLESLIGVKNPEQLKSKRQEFENYALDDFDLLEINKILQEDALDYYYSGIISIADGISSLLDRKYSWATIKFYYGIFYLLRATLGLNRYAILQNSGVYILKIAKYEMPKKKNNRKYTTTHLATINYYTDLFKSDDYLLSNQINGKTTYQWMLEAREIVNYKCRSFMEPGFLDIWRVIDTIKNKNDFESIFENLITNPDLFCFQEEYAIMTIPIKRLIITTDLIQKLKLLDEIGALRKEYLKKILNYEAADINLHSVIFNDTSDGLFLL